MILNPNCSEAIMRINLMNLKEEERKVLKEHIKELEDEGSSYSDSIWYDTDWCESDVFGTKIIEIKGETPYNHWDELEDYLRQLPFFGILDIEGD